MTGTDAPRTITVERRLAVYAGLAVLAVIGGLILAVCLLAGSTGDDDHGWGPGMMQPYGGGSGTVPPMYGPGYGNGPGYGTPMPYGPDSAQPPGGGKGSPNG